MGAMARQGPHQVAQKSTRTGLSDFRTSWSKFAAVTSTIPLPAISFSPRCNVALFGGCSHVSETTSSRGRDPDDLNGYDSINAFPNLGATHYGNTAIRCVGRREGRKKEGAVRRPPRDRHGLDQEI